jgi:pyridoxamine 5'-phosphate oxidase
MATLAGWLEDARARLPGADAMALATATPQGVPSVRIVLVRSLDERGVAFFTNRESRKGRELRGNPWAAGCLHWWELGRQARVEGPVEELDETESTAYWVTRPRASQLAAWASRQSQRLASREELLSSFAEQETRFAGGDVPLPPFWGGYRMRVEAVELWTHRADRLHDRVAYARAGDTWTRELLSP